MCKGKEFCLTRTRHQDSRTNRAHQTMPKTMVGRHVGDAAIMAKFIHSDNCTLRHNRTNWSNFVSCSKYYEDKLDPDFLEDFDETIYLRLTATRDFEDEDVAYCTIRIPSSGTGHRWTLERESEDIHSGHSYVNCGQFGDVHLKPDFLKLKEDRVDDTLHGILNELLKSLASTFEYLHIDNFTSQLALPSPSPSELSSCKQNSLYTWWAAEETDVRKSFFEAKQQDHVSGGEFSPWSTGQRDNEGRDVRPSSYVLAQSRKDRATSGAKTDSLQKSRSMILSANNLLSMQDSRELSRIQTLLEKHCDRDLQEYESAESVIIQAIVVFLDVFEDALECPNTPLMQLDADSLVLNELADTLSKSCNKTVKVVDLFTSGRNSCAGLLRFLSGNASHQ